MKNENSIKILSTRKRLCIVIPLGNNCAATPQVFQYQILEKRLPEKAEHKHKNPFSGMLQ